MWVLFILIISIFVLFIDFIIAKQFAEIAKMKGHDDSKYFWFTFLFGLIGMLMVIALPNVQQEKIGKLHESLANQTIATPKLDEYEDVPVNDMPNENLGEFWFCGRCKSKNLGTRNDCWSCGNKK